MGKVTDFDKLSERQQNILHFMYDYMEANGFPPTIREIGEATDINSTSVVNYNLNKLVKAGYLDRSDRVSRGLRIITHIPGRGKPKDKIIQVADKTAEIPIYGRIAAGIPIDVEQQTDDFIEVTPMLLDGADPSEVYALVVKGDSMIDAMVNEGDIVLLRHQNTANRGEMVAAYLPDDNETTLKYFYPEGDKIRLQPAHPTMDAIIVDARNCEIHGKVLSIIRRVH